MLLPAKLTQDQFIEKSNITHNNKYLYTKAVYKSNKKLLTITCPIHGDFEQRPRNHMKGEGCPTCGNLNRIITNKLTTSEFIEKSSKIFPQNDYSNAIITNGTRSQVNITCTTHNYTFTQRADSHIAGKQGCKHYKSEQTSKSLVDFYKHTSSKSTYSYTKWESNGYASKNFEGFSLYIIKCYNEEEEFIKIGKIYTSVQTRFQDKILMPYKWVLLHKITGDAITISEMEASLHKEHNMHKFSPTKYFPGHTECFSTDIITTIIGSNIPMLMQMPTK